MYPHLFSFQPYDTRPGQPRITNKQRYILYSTDSAQYRSFYETLIVQVHDAPRLVIPRREGTSISEPDPTIVVVFGQRRGLSSLTNKLHPFTSRIVWSQRGRCDGGAAEIQQRWHAL